MQCCHVFYPGYHFQTASMPYFTLLVGKLGKLKNRYSLCVFVIICGVNGWVGLVWLGLLGKESAFLPPTFHRFIYKYKDFLINFKGFYVLGEIACGTLLTALGGNLGVFL